MLNLTAISKKMLLLESQEVAKVLALLKWQLPVCWDVCDFVPVRAFCPQFYSKPSSSLHSISGFLPRILRSWTLATPGQWEVLRNDQCKRKEEASPPHMTSSSCLSSRTQVSSGRVQRFSSFFQMTWPPEHTASPFCPSSLRVLVIILGCLTDRYLIPVSLSLL